MKPGQVLQVCKMSFLEELVCILFLGFGVPNGVFTIPLATFLIGRFLLGNVKLAFQVLFLLLLPLAILPQEFVPSTLHSWLAEKIVKYFSYRFVFDQRPVIQPKERKEGETIHPQLLVAPPHGVFPYGNILSMILWPSVCGHHFYGLASSAALRAPVFKQIMKSIGCIDASRETARRALAKYPYTLGISTGGVAEVFETNRDDEVILLKERIGLIKLAIRTGAALVPAYEFGNTKLLSCWAGEGIPGGHSFLQKLSRRLGFALIIIHGRFGLPIPFRIPVFGVIGKPIPTAHIKCENPTDEQIAQIQEELINSMQSLFDRYKGMYGWEDKRLVIK